MIERHDITVQWAGLAVEVRCSGEPAEIPAGGEHGGDPGWFDAAIVAARYVDMDAWTMEFFGEQEWRAIHSVWPRWRPELHRTVCSAVMSWVRAHAGTIESLAVDELRERGVL